AVIGIYDRDSGSGAQFPPEPDEEFMDDDDAQDSAPKLSLADTGKVQALHRVSNNRSSDADSVDEGDGPPDDDPTPPRSSGKKGKTSRLRIVK
ncbi:MAG: ClpXP protease specificity-enhancing factor SspB, partial [Halothiobacillus sp.]